MQIFSKLQRSFPFTGWVDDSLFDGRTGHGQDQEGWNHNGSSAVNPGAFTTGRGRPTRGLPPPIKPRSQVS